MSFEGVPSGLEGFKQCFNTTNVKVWQYIMTKRHIVIWTMFGHRATSPFVCGAMHCGRKWWVCTPFYIIVLNLIMLLLIRYACSANTSLINYLSCSLICHYLQESKIQNENSLQQFWKKKIHQGQIIEPHQGKTSSLCGHRIKRV